MFSIFVTELRVKHENYKRLKNKIRENKLCNENEI